MRTHDSEAHPQKLPQKLQINTSMGVKLTCEYSYGQFVGISEQAVKNAQLALERVYKHQTEFGIGRVIAKSLEDRLNTGGLLAIAVDGASSELGFWNVAPELKGKILNNRELDGTVIVINTHSADIDLIAPSIIHEGTHDWVYLQTGSLYCDPCGQEGQRFHKDSAYIFELNYQKDCRNYLLKNKLHYNNVPRNSDFVLFRKPYLEFKKHLQLYLKKWAHEQHGDISFFTQEIMNDMERAYYNGCLELDFLGYLNLRDIDTILLGEAVTYASMIRRSEVCAYLSTVDFISVTPGKAVELLPCTFAEWDSLLKIGSEIEGYKEEELVQRTNLKITEKITLPRLNKANVQVRENISLASRNVIDVHADNMQKFGVIDYPICYAPIRLDNVHQPIPPFRELTAEAIRQVTERTTFMAAILPDGRLIVTELYSEPVRAFIPEYGWSEPRPIRLIHPEITGMSNVVWAGEIIAENGQIVEINNRSGHYKPDEPKLQETIAKHVLAKNNFPVKNAKYVVHTPRPNKFALVKTPPSKPIKMDPNLRIKPLPLQPITPEVSQETQQQESINLKLLQPSCHIKKLFESDRLPSISAQALDAYSEIKISDIDTFEIPLLEEGKKAIDDLVTDLKVKPFKKLYSYGYISGPTRQLVRNALKASEMIAHSKSSFVRAIHEAFVKNANNENYHLILLDEYQGEPLTKLAPAMTTCHGANDLPQLTLIAGDYEIEQLAVLLFNQEAYAVKKWQGPIEQLTLSQLEAANQAVLWQAKINLERWHPKIKVLKRQQTADEELAANNNQEIHILIEKKQGPFWTEQTCYHLGFAKEIDGKNAYTLATLNLKNPRHKIFVTRLRQSCGTFIDAAYSRHDPLSHELDISTSYELQDTIQEIIASEQGVPFENIPLELYAQEVASDVTNLIGMHYKSPQQLFDAIHASLLELEFLFPYHAQRFIPSSWANYFKSIYPMGSLGLIALDDPFIADGQDYRYQYANHLFFESEKTATQTIPQIADCYSHPSKFANHMYTINLQTAMAGKLLTLIDDKCFITTPSGEIARGLYHETNNYQLPDGTIYNGKVIKASSESLKINDHFSDVLNHENTHAYFSIINNSTMCNPARTIEQSKALRLSCLEDIEYQAYLRTVHYPITKLVIAKNRINLNDLGSIARSQLYIPSSKLEDQYDFSKHYIKIGKFKNPKPLPEVPYTTESSIRLVSDYQQAFANEMLRPAELLSNLVSLFRHSCTFPPFFINREMIREIHHAQAEVGAHWGNLVIKDESALARVFPHTHATMTKIEQQNYQKYIDTEDRPQASMPTAITPPLFMKASGGYPPTLIRTLPLIGYGQEAHVPTLFKSFWLEPCYMEGPVFYDGKWHQAKLAGQRVMTSVDGKAVFVRWNAPIKVMAEPLPFWKQPAFANFVNNGLFWGINAGIHLRSAYHQDPTGPFLLTGTYDCLGNTIASIPVLAAGPYALPFVALAAAPSQRRNFNEAYVDLQLMPHPQTPADFMVMRQQYNKAMDYGALHAMQVLSQGGLSLLAYVGKGISNHLVSVTPQFVINGATYASNKVHQGVINYERFKATNITPIVRKIPQVVPDLEKIYQKENQALASILTEMRAKNASPVQIRATIKDFYDSHPFANPEIQSAILTQKGINVLARGIGRFFETKQMKEHRKMMQESDSLLNHLRRGTQQLATLNAQMRDQANKVPPSQSATAKSASNQVTSSSNQNRNEALAAIFQAVDPVPRNLATRPFEQLPSKVTFDNAKLYQLPNGNLMVQLPPGTLGNFHQEIVVTGNPQVTSAKPDTKQLSGLNTDLIKPGTRILIAGSNSNFAGNGSRTQPIAMKPKPISDIRLTIGTSGIGMAATVYGAGGVSFELAKDGVLFTLKVAFGPNFWPAMGLGIGVGAAIAGAMLLTKYFIDRHQQRIEEKINRSLKHTGKDFRLVAGKSNQLIANLKSAKGEDSNNFLALLMELDATLQLINKRIRKQGDREASARHLDSKKAANQHSKIASEYRGTGNNLLAIRPELAFAYERSKFIETNQNKSSAELLQIARDLSGGTYNSAYAAKLNGIKHLLQMAAINLVAKGECDQANDLLLQTSALDFHKPVEQAKNQEQAFDKNIDKKVDEFYQIGYAQVHERDKRGNEIKDKFRIISAEEAKRILRAGGGVEFKPRHGKNWKHGGPGGWTSMVNPYRQQSGENYELSADLNGFQHLITKLTEEREQPSTYWLEQLAETTQNKEGKSAEEVLLIRVIAKDTLLNKMLSQASQGNVEPAKQILEAMKPHLPEDKELFSRFQGKLAELQPYVNKGAGVWLRLIEEMNLLPAKDLGEEHNLIKAMGVPIILQEIIQQSGQGNIKFARQIIAKLVAECPDQKILTDRLSSTLNNIEPNLSKGANFWIEFIKTQLEKPLLPSQDEKQATSGYKPDDLRRVEDAIYKAVGSPIILSEAISTALGGDFSSATTLLEAFRKAVPSQSELINPTLKTLEKFGRNKAQLIDFSLDEIKRVADMQSIPEGTSNNPEITSEDRASNDFGRQCVLKELLTYASKGEFDHAKDLLARLKNSNKNESPFADKLITQLEQAKSLPLDAENLFLRLDGIKARENLLKKEREKEKLARETLDLKKSDKPEQDSKLDDSQLEVDLDKNIHITLLQKTASSRSERGFYREAAVIYETLKRKESSLDLEKPTKLSYFAHQGQVITIFAKPIQGMISRFVQGMQPSIGKTVAAKSLEAVNTLQIVAPNAVSMTLQYLDAKWAGDTSTFFHCYEEMKKHLHEDLLSPLRSFNGFTISYQLALKAIENLPLEKFAPLKYRLSALHYKQTFLQLGSQGMRGLMLSNTAKQLYKFGLDHAYAPQWITTIIHLGYDLARWGYHSHLQRKGKAIEDPSFYLKEDAAVPMLDAISGSVSMALILKGPKNWMSIAAGVLGLVATAYHLTCSASRTDASCKAIIAAIANSNFYANLKALDQYICQCELTITMREPADSQLERVRTGKQIIFALKGRTHGEMYYAGQGISHQVKTLTREQAELFHSIHTLASPKADMLLDENAPLVQIRNIIRNFVLVSNVGTYLESANYMMQATAPDADQLQQVKEGRLIVVAKEGPKYILYFRARDAQEVTQFEFDDHSYEYRLLTKNLSFVRANLYISDIVRELATHCVLENYRNISRARLRSQLQTNFSSSFDGLTYVADQPQAANIARLTDFYYSVKDCHERKEFDKVIALTEKNIHPDGSFSINKQYQIPAYIAWQIIVRFRLAAIAESDQHLLRFRAEYDEYSKYIYKSPEEWWAANRNEIIKNLKDVVSFALQQYIVAADKAKEEKEKKQYLNMVTGHCQYIGSWQELLSNELKLFISHIHFTLNQLDESKLFFTSITNLLEFLKSRKKEEFSSQALVVLSKIDEAKHNELLLRADRQEYAITDGIIYQRIRSLHSQKKYQEALELIMKASSLEKRTYFEALTLFLQSNGKDILSTLKALMQQPLKDLDSWLLLYNLFLTCINSIKYMTNESLRMHCKLKLYCLVKACIDKIQEFEIPVELKQDTLEMEEILQEFFSHYHQAYLQSPQQGFFCKSVQELTDYAHRCIRGEMGVNLLIEIKKVLTSFSYTFVEDQIEKRYLPIDVPADHECAFHVMGIERKEGMMLLSNLIRSYSYQCVQTSTAKEIYEILLEDLAFHKKRTFNNDPASFERNKASILEYLEFLCKPKTWMPFIQYGRSVLNALALAMNKNLRIFMHNVHAELCIASETRFSQTYPTIDMLITCASGLSMQESTLNHYIVLQYLPLACELMVENPSLHASTMPMQAK